MRARVHITLKRGVHDPQGKAVANALAALGFEGIEAVRQGKYIEIDLVENDRRRAAEAVAAMCAKLLSNPVIEDYAVAFADADEEESRTLP